MGQEIVYCWKCNNRILGSDFEKGSAFQVGVHSSCAACASELLAKLPAGEREKLLGKMFRTTKEKGAGSSRSLPRIAPPTAIPTRRPKPFPVGLVAGGAGALIFLIVIIAVLSRGGGAADAPPRPPAPAPVSEGEARARAAVGKAREAARSKPGEVEALSLLWQEAMWASENSPALLAEARREYALVSARAKDVLSKEENELRAFVEKEEFGKALDYLQAARARRPEWAQRKIVETRELPKSLFPALRDKALEAKILGSGDAKAVEARVARWGIEEYPVDLKKAMEAVGSEGTIRPAVDGLVCFEAEAFHGKEDKGGHAWTRVETPAGAVGKAAMSPLPNTGKSLPTGFAARSPRLDYRINFLKPGSYHVWIRATGDAASDSLHVGIDGVESPPDAAVEVVLGKGWVWARKTQGGAMATVEVRTIGLHTLNLWMREDGVVVDRVVLSPRSDYKPDGDGPPASGTK